VGSKSKYEEARAAGYSHDEIRDYLLSKGLESPIWTFEMPNGHVFEVPANTTKDEASEVGRDYMRLLERLKWERWKEMLTKSLIIWMVPSLLALALGWSVGWIWKGFRIKA
jgi:hypothetical protein